MKIFVIFRRTSFSGFALVNYLTANGLADDRSDAVKYGRRLVLGKIVEHVRQEEQFFDSKRLMYRFVESQLEMDGGAEELFVHDIVNCSWHFFFIWCTFNSIQSTQTPPQPPSLKIKRYGLYQSTPPSQSANGQFRHSAILNCGHDTKHVQFIQATSIVAICWLLRANRVGMLLGILCFSIGAVHDWHLILIVTVIISISSGFWWKKLWFPFCLKIIIIINGFGEKNFLWWLPIFSLLFFLVLCHAKKLRCAIYKKNNCVVSFNFMMGILFSFLLIAKDGILLTYLSKWKYRLLKNIKKAPNVK